MKINFNENSIKPSNYRQNFTGNQNKKILEQKRAYSTKASPDYNLNSDSKLNPWWVTGFADAESSFKIYAAPSREYKLG